MSRREIRALVAAQSTVDTAALERMIAGDPGLRLAGVLEHEDEWSRRSGYEADALVIACEQASPDVVALVAEERASEPARPVVVVCDFPPNGFVREVFDAGADDIVFAPGFERHGSDVFFALEKAMTRRAGPVTGEHARGNLIAVLGPKGGTGKTMTATNLAAAIAAEGHRVGLVDLDLQFGDLALTLGLEPARTIFDLVAAGGTLDSLKLDAYLTTHSSGARVLLAPTRPDHAAAVTPEFLRDLFAVMRQQFDYVLVDTPPGFTPEVIATIDMSTALVLVGTLDLPSLKNAKLGAEALDRMGYPRERVHLLLNRADSSVGVSQADVTAVLGRVPDVLVPSHRDVVRSVNAGQPIVISHPRSDAAKALKALAQVLTTKPEPDGSPMRPRRRRILVRS